MNILDELWYGNINPQEESKEHNRAIKELLNLMGRNRDQLQANMTPEQQVILEKYDDCVNEIPHWIIFQNNCKLLCFPIFSLA